MPKPPTRRSRAWLAALAVFCLSVVGSMVAIEPAAACGTQGSSQAGYTYSSQLTATQLVVCNSSPGVPAQPIVAPPSTKTTKSKVAVVTCSTITQRVYLGAPSYASKLVKTTSCSTGWISMVAVVPPPPATPATKTSTITNTQPGSGTTSLGAAAQTAQEGFSPDPIAVVASPTTLALGQDSALSTTAIAHYRASVLLGQAVTVQFVPVQISWDFGDGATQLGTMGELRATRHGYASAGQKLVSATVSFVASYRFAGQQVWTTESGLLTRKASVALAIQQPAQPSRTAGRVRLVAQDCLQNPRGRGCP